MYKTFASSNFYSSIHMAYNELAGFGTCCLLEDEDPEKTVRFLTLTAGEYYLAEDRRGLVDTVYRTAWMSAAQMEQEFGRDEPLSDHGEEPAWSMTRTASFQVLHLVEPQHRSASRRSASNALRTCPGARSIWSWSAGRPDSARGRLSGVPLPGQPLVGVLAAEVYGRGPGHAMCCPMSRCCRRWRRPT
jgi:hypothetical protein